MIHSGFKSVDKVCLTEEICAYDTEFGEISTSGSITFSNDGILGLAMGDIPDYPTPFTQSVMYFRIKIYSTDTDFDFLCLEFRLYITNINYKTDLNVSYALHC